MNIDIVTILDPGIANQERLYLRASSADDIGSYIVFDTVQRKPGTISSASKNTYWFPNAKVNAGDKIVLYTKIGIKSIKENSDGTKTFFFYWGKNKTLWNDKGDAVALLKIGNWTYKVRE